MIFKFDVLFSGCVHCTQIAVSAWSHVCVASTRMSRAVELSLLHPRRNGTLSPWTHHSNSCI